VPDNWLARESARLPPGSPSAYGFAVFCVAVATLARLIVGWFGADLPFATYFPAALVVAVLAGPSAAVFAIVLSIFTVWWAFVPPIFAFGRLRPADAMNMALFALAALCIVYVAQRYRMAVQRLRDNERKRQLEMRELEHRGKNTFAVVESIVRKTLEEQPDVADVIAGRIQSVSSTNDIINRTEGHTATLDTILRNELTAYDLSRVELSGPRIELAADVARPVALVIHELVTNAAKYGALSKPEGRVRAAWRSNGGTVQIDWSESGGPEVKAPTGYGFGSRLIGRTLKSLSGTVEPTFDPDGLKCRLEFQR
jgi:two-component sensor histidine kinase